MYNIQKRKQIAYFSMEIGVNKEMKTYAGGLGILAGDTLKSAADLEVNMVGMSILYKYGYFKQSINESDGMQNELNDDWDYENILKLEDKKTEMTVEGRKVVIQIWRYDIIGQTGHVVPVYFLDTDLHENDEKDRYISYSLYSKYHDTRILQEIILGAGGVKALDSLEIDVDKYHLNESHAAFAVFPLLDKYLSKEEVRKRIVFTTHTPIKHGHRGYDQWTYKRFLTHEWFDKLDTTLEKDNKILLTDICLSHSSYNNAVARKHAETSRDMFPDHEIDYITNGIHHLTWVSEHTAKLFDRYILDWRDNPMNLRNAFTMRDGNVINVHELNKKDLINYINERYQKNFVKDVFTIGFGRRIDGYKRADLIFKNWNRLKEIANKYGGLQLVFAGKSFPDIDHTESTISRIYELSNYNDEDINTVFLEDYDIEIAKYMVSGSDLWLNNPIRPLEASGTSGMKAALNGVPSLSSVDGWWVEGHIEDVTGWSIGDENSNIGDEEYEANEIYRKLDEIILPKFFYDTKGWSSIQKNCIALNAGYFNTHRLVGDYVVKGYSI